MGQLEAEIDAQNWIRPPTAEPGLPWASSNGIF
jgi:hypothetical protein